MKKILILLAILSIVACGDKKPKEGTETETAPVVIEEVVKEEASEMKGAVTEKASEMKGAVTEKASEMKGAVTEKASEMKSAVTEEVSEMMGSTETTSMEEVPSTYIVKKGDSLYKIGQKYNVPWTKLVEENNIKNPNDIYIGQEIKIPQN